MCESHGGTDSDAKLWKDRIVLSVNVQYSEFSLPEVLKSVLCKFTVSIIVP